MSTFASDAFIEASDTALQSHTPDVGGSWAKNAFVTGSMKVSGALDRVRPDEPSFGDACYNNAGVPGSADYSVEADFVFVSNVGGSYVWVTGRYDSSTGGLYRGGWAGGSWELAKGTGFSGSLGTASGTGYTAGNTYHAKLDLSGTTLNFYVDGVLKIGPVTDSTYTAKGLAGIKSADQVDDSHGIHIDNFSAADAGGGGGGSALGSQYYRRLAGGGSF